LREERRLRVFENMVLRRIMGPKRDKVTGNRENFIIRSIMICTPHPLGHAVAQWLRYCATNRKVAALNPDGVTGIFH
jgi:hypothetical protein